MRVRPFQGRGGVRLRFPGALPPATISRPCGAAISDGAVSRMREARGFVAMAEEFLEPSGGKQA